MAWVEVAVEDRDLVEDGEEAILIHIADFTQVFPEGGGVCLQNTGRAWDWMFLQHFRVLECGRLAQVV
jgi:hypothetical protein